jgi:cytochrome c-type biogenesis protein CcmF
VIGSHFFQQQQDTVLNSGQSMQIAGNRLLYYGNIQETGPGTVTVKSILQVWHNGQYEGYLYPGRVTYQSFGGQPASLIAIPTFDLTDVYVLLEDPIDSVSQAHIRVFINPLVSLVWFGGLLMLVGGVICWWPARRRQRVVDTVSAPGGPPVKATSRAAHGQAPLVRRDANGGVGVGGGGSPVKQSRSSPLLARMLRRS